MQNFIQDSIQKSGVVGSKFDYIVYTSPCGYSGKEIRPNMPVINLSGLTALPTDGKGNVLSIDKIKRGFTLLSWSYSF